MVGSLTFTLPPVVRSVTCPASLGLLAATALEASVKKRAIAKGAKRARSALVFFMLPEGASVCGE